MCGIIGYIGKKTASDVLLDGLKKLEYRGYDSSGVAVLTNGRFELRRAVGKLSGLEKLIHKNPLEGHMGLGHTRWATHGAPSEDNSHPHADSTGKIVVVHNGIIENYRTLKDRLIKEGFKFRSDTDTEVIAHLIGSHFKSGSSKKASIDRDAFVAAVQSALKEIQGTYALGVVCSKVPDLVIGARRDCPLIVGRGDGETFLASDVPAVLSHTRNVVFLNDGDMVLLTQDSITVLNETGDHVERSTSKIMWDPMQAEKAGYKHFMLKEIHEQPRVVEDTLLGRLHSQSRDVNLPDMNLSTEDVKSLSHIRFIACGTSWHAALTGSFWLEKYTGIPCQVDIASEFRYRDPIIEPNTLVVAISQSGETADTIAAFRLAKRKGAKCVAIANVVGSSLTRDADGVIMTHCGPEIGVASTKAFMGQLVALYLLTLFLAGLRKSLPAEKIRELGKNLSHLSQWVTAAVESEKEVMKIAKKYSRKVDFLFLGRNLNYPIALEGALKLKEISYIHAEGYPAGEMKHGPIALIDENMPVVAIVTESQVYEKMLSNIEEAKSRGAIIISIATKGDKMVQAKSDNVIYVPKVPEDFGPMVNVVPLQLLAYQIAVLRGCDVDQPRNLAKSVTVE
jgi:glucosamine--fructose-6-phosphate aminotransferase (isomerizing)